MAMLPFGFVVNLSHNIDNVFCRDILLTDLLVALKKASGEIMITSASTSL